MNKKAIANTNTTTNNNNMGGKKMQNHALMMEKANNMMDYAQDNIEVLGYKNYIYNSDDSGVIENTIGMLYSLYNSLNEDHSEEEEKDIFRKLDEVNDKLEMLAKKKLIAEYKRQSITTTEISLYRVKDEKGHIVADDCGIRSTMPMSGMLELAKEMFGEDLDIITVTFEGYEDSDEEQVFKGHMKKMLTEGFTCIKEGGETKHYSFFSFSPSQQREQKCLFINATWEQVKALFAKLCGVDAINDDTIKDLFGEKLSISKMCARFSMALASGVWLKAIDPVTANNLKALTSAKGSVVIVDDVNATNETPFWNPTAPEDDSQKGNKRDVVLADGSMVVSREFQAEVAYGYAVITMKERKKVIAEARKIRKGAIKDFSKYARKIIKKMDSAIQMRVLGSPLKGVIVFTDLEKFVKNNVHVIAPESIVKFNQTEWDFSNLVVCSTPNNKGGFVALNGPIITSFYDADMHMLDDVMKYWFNKIAAALNGNIGMALSMMNLYGNNYKKDEEEDFTQAFKQAITANAMMIKDSYLRKTFFEKIEKMVQRMASGKVMVPGDYPYMICDPHFFIKSAIEQSVKNGDNALIPNCSLDKIPVLGKGEYYYNGKECRSILARSPLAHPNQVQIVQLKNNESYSLYKDVLIYNAEDAIWVDQAGADFDGDRTLAAFEETVGDFKAEYLTEMFDYVENKKKNCVVNFEEALSGKKEDHFGLDTLSDYVCRNMCGTTIGLLNDTYTNTISLVGHLGNIVAIAKAKNLENLLFSGVKADAYLRVSTKHNALAFYWPDMRVRNKNGELVEPNGFFIGQNKLVSIEEAEKLIDNLLNNADQFEVFQSREVDAPKTDAGVKKEAVRDYTVRITPDSHVIMKMVKGAINSHSWQLALDEIKQDYFGSEEEVDGMSYPHYLPCTLMGNVMKTCMKFWAEVVDPARKAEAACLSPYVFALLTDEEREQYFEVSQKVSAIHTTYGEKMQEIYGKNGKYADLEDEQKVAMGKACAEEAKASLSELVANGYNPQTVAVTAYVIRYTTEDKKSKAFGWFMTNELCRVLRRGNMKCMFYSVPENAEKILIDEEGMVSYEIINEDGNTEVKETKATIKNMYAQEAETMYDFSGRKVALIRVRTEDAINVKEVHVPSMKSTYGVEVFIKGYNPSLAKKANEPMIKEGMKLVARFWNNELYLMSADKKNPHVFGVISTTNAPYAVFFVNKAVTVAGVNNYKNSAKVTLTTGWVK